MPNDEVVSLLQELLRLDTSNPPGNETAAAETVKAYLERAGISCELYAREAHRANLVARLPGRDPSAPRLLLLAHLDTVGAEATLQPETEQFLAVVLGEPEPTAASVEKLRSQSSGAAAMLEPMLGATVVPTQIGGSDARNVIPSACEIRCDCHLLPGQPPEEVESAIRDALGEGGFELRWESVTGGTRSAPAS